MQWVSPPLKKVDKMKVKKITINASNGSPCGGLKEVNWVGVDFLDGTSEYYETENQVVSESDGEKIGEK